MPIEWIHPNDVIPLKKRIKECVKRFHHSEIKQRSGVSRRSFENALKGIRIKKDHADKLQDFLTTENL